jgi:hypothetical protein
VMPNLEALPAEAVSEAAQTAKPESTANGSGAAMLGVVGAAPPTPVSPLTAVVSGAPGPGVTNGDDPSDSAPSDSSDDATVASQQPRRWGPMGLFRTVAPWSATDERDGSSAGEGAATDEPE